MAIEGSIFCLHTISILMISYDTYQTFSSADIQSDSISKHLDSFKRRSINLDTSVISSSTEFPGPLAYIANKIYFLAAMDL